MRAWILLAAAVCLVEGCLGLGGVTPPTHYYVLEARATSSAPGAADGAAKDPESGLVVSVAGIPRYLDRPHIVERKSGSEVALADLERWAEPLADGIQRVTVENLRRLLPRRAIESSQIHARGESFQTLRVEIIDMWGSQGASAGIEARWQIRAASQQVSGEHRERIEAPVSGSGAQPLVLAWSELLARLAEKMQATLRS